MQTKNNIKGKTKRSNMGLFNDFKDGVGTTGKGLSMVLGGTAKLAGTVGKAAFKGVKVVAKGAIDMMLSSSENSVLDYCYEGDLDLRAHKVLSQALVDLTMRRPWDSYLWCILSHCENLCLSDKSGQLLDDKKFRSICRGMLSDDKSAKEKIEKQFDEFFQKHNEYNEDDIKEAFNKYSNLFMNNHHDYVSKVFVKSVGEDIREPVYNDNGEPLRDANGGYVEKVVGRNDSVAVFKVTFSSGHSIMIKVRNGSFGHLRPNSYI